MKSIHTSCILFGPAIRNFLTETLRTEKQEPRTKRVIIPSQCNKLPNQWFKRQKVERTKLEKNDEPRRWIPQ